MQTCDVFCKIVDNFGDIGVCWRLSHQLATEHRLSVRLLIDDFDTASQIIPTLSSVSSSQKIQGVTVMPWPESSIDLPDLIIENFSCGVPDAYARLVTDAQSSGKTVHWINLEYLSAEKWVEDFHLMPSENPQLGFKKTFYYPGFSEKTGGLLREKDLLAQQTLWLTEAEETRFWQSLNLNSQQLNQAMKLSLFCYPQADSLGLIDALRQLASPITLFIPCDKYSDMAQFLIEHFAFDATGNCRLGNLSLQTLPFLSQTQFDQLLMYCDLNFVRGEDSWIRALWSGKPFIWQPYIQAEDTHLIKLKAFLAQYLDATEASDPIKTTIQQAHLLWSNALPQANSQYWREFINALPEWTVASKQASDYFRKQKSLSDQLMEWVSQND